MTRAEIRAEIRDKREKISVIQAAELSARICERALALPEYRKAKRVLSYASLLGEVQTQSLNLRVLSDGKELYLPRVLRGRAMEALRVTDIRSLRPGAMGIPEPEPGAPVDPMELDLIFVPGIAFDREGGRIGFGGGYYDRYLPGTRAVRVALAFEMQMIEDTCAEPHDQTMHAILTEDGIYGGKFIVG